MLRAGGCRRGFIPGGRPGRRRISGDSMTGLGVAVFGDQFIADFRVAHSLLFEFAGHQRAVQANLTASGMSLLIATVQALVSDASVAVAETRQLSESLRNILRHLISVSHLSAELHRR